MIAWAKERILDFFTVTRSDRGHNNPNFLDMTSFQDPPLVHISKKLKLAYNCFKTIFKLRESSQDWYTFNMEFLTSPQLEEGPLLSKKLGRNQAWISENILVKKNFQKVSRNVRNLMWKVYQSWLFSPFNWSFIETPLGLFFK